MVCSDSHCSGRSARAEARNDGDVDRSCDRTSWRNARMFFESREYLRHIPAEADFLIRSTFGKARSGFG